MVAGAEKAIAAAIAPLLRRIEQLEARKPEPGPPGEKGEPGERGEKGEAGADGSNGRDGAGIVDGFVSRDGHLIATLSDGTTKDFGEIIGKDGRDGVDGAQGEPGFSLDDFNIEPGEDGRTYTLKFERGETRHTYELTFPAPVYCGVWKEGGEYVPGDIVTFGGSAFHCNSVDPGKPETKDSGWQLMVKRGRDGKDARG